jgi:pimeloyl-ACP methyl ester carboxylesterase
MSGRWLRKPTAGTSVVFVHGILSNSESAWCNSKGETWPSFLAEEPDFQQIGIYAFDYYTTPFSGSYSLGNVVDALKEHLRFDGLYKAQRLIFVCHSMGGIVVRKFIVDRQLDILSAGIRIGLFLVASPSLGGSYATLFSKLLFFLHNSQLNALKFSQDNSWLNDLDTTFRNLFQRAMKGESEGYVLSIFGKELVEDKFIAFKKWWRKQIVPPFAGATYFGEAIRIPESDHFSIAKPTDRAALQHRLLCQFLNDELKLPAGVSPANHVSDAPNVRLIIDPSDHDLILALHLYEDRIPEEERFESADIIRWLREDIENRKASRTAARDYFLIETHDGKVRGCSLIHYYPETSFAFFAYLVADRGVNVDPQDISFRIIRKIAELFTTDEWLKTCESILFEVDDPRTARTEEQKRERLARIRLFSTLSAAMGFELRILEIPYRQPLVFIPSTQSIDVEVRMLLIEVFPRGHIGFRSGVLKKSEVARRLEFIYLYLYPEGFSDVEEENKRYKNYLKNLHNEESSKVPDPTRLLSVSEFRKSF